MPLFHLPCITPVISEARRGYCQSLPCALVPPSASPVPLTRPPPAASTRTPSQFVVKIISTRSTKCNPGHSLLKNPSKRPTSRRIKLKLPGDLRQLWWDVRQPPRRTHLPPATLPSSLCTPRSCSACGPWLVRPLPGAPGPRCLCTCSSCSLKSH